MRHYPHLGIAITCLLILGSFAPRTARAAEGPLPTVVTGFATPASVYASLGGTVNANGTYIANYEGIRPPRYPEASADFNGTRPITIGWSQRT